jgi:probable HAF family extracellular repeat protein
VPDAAQTQAIGINNRGQVVGEYVDGDGAIHGFRWDRGVTTLDGPDDAAGTGATDMETTICPRLLMPKGRVNPVLGASNVVHPGGLQAGNDKEARERRSAWLG